MLLTMYLFSFLVFCCYEHIGSSIEIRRECAFWLNEFLIFVNNKIVEEYFCWFFSFETQFVEREEENPEAAYSIEKC